MKRKEISSILSKHWGIDSLLREETSGGSRGTWQLENGSWLTRCGKDRADSFQRETRLLTILSKRLASTPVCFATPQVLPTLEGETLAMEDQHFWRITKHIPGVKLSASDFRAYPVLIQALDDLHALTEDLMPLHSAALQTGVVDSLKSLAATEVSQIAIARVLHWALPRLFQLDQLPRVLTHGDFNPTNLIYQEDPNGLRVAGILDFELSRPDPAIMDFGQLFTMIVCHSGSPHPRRETDKILSLLNGRFTHEQLCLAMATFWLELYFRWKDVSPAAEARIRMRLEQVWDFISPAEN